MHSDFFCAPSVRTGDRKYTYKFYIIGCCLIGFAVAAEIAPASQYKGNYNVMGHQEKEILATRAWTGGGVDSNWTTGANWTSLPIAGDDLAFPSGAQRLSNTNNFVAGTSFNSIAIAASGYSLSGNAINLAAGVTASYTTSVSTLGLNVTLTANQTFTAVNGGTLAVSGSLSDGSSDYRIDKTGTGTLRLSGVNAYSGGTTITQGTLVIQNSSALGVGSTTVGTGATLQFEGGINNSSPITVQGTGVGGGGAITNASGNNTTSGNITLAASTVISVASGTRLTVNAPIADGGSGYGITKTSTGTLVLQGTSSYSGATMVSNGLLQVDGAISSSSVQVGSSGTLTGNGNVGAITVSDGGTLMPGNSPGILTANGEVAIDDLSTFAVTLAGTTAGTYSQLVAVGGVNLGGAVLALTDTGFARHQGDQFTIIDNQSSLVITETFNGLGEGDTFTIGANVFSISYAGGDGNDVVLTLDAINITWTGFGSNNLWSNGDNWGMGVAPAAGSDLIFPNGAARLANVNDLTANTGFYSITIGASGYSLSGSVINLEAGIVADYVGTSTIDIDTVFTANPIFGVVSGATLDISGTLSDGASDFGIDKLGEGTLRLSGANTYSGSTTITQGTLVVQNNDALGSASIIVSGGATLEFRDGISILNPVTVAGLGVGEGGAITNTSGNNTIGGDITLTGNTLVSAMPGTRLTLNGGGADGVAYSLTKVGSGTLAIQGMSSYSGAATVEDGTLQVDGDISSSPIQVHGTLTGNGSVGAIAVSNTGSLAPGNGLGILTANGMVTLVDGSAFSVTLADTTIGPIVAGTDYSQLMATGNVSLGNAILSVSNVGAHNIGDQLKIIDNQSLSGISGTFNGLSEGGTFTAGADVFSISYVGGTGNNDVVLTVAAPDLTLTKTHVGNIMLGEAGGAYALTVKNQGLAPTTGLVTVTDTLPTGLSPAETGEVMSVNGWTCTINTPTIPATVVCTRVSLAAGESSLIELILDVARNVTYTNDEVTNTASVSGGGDSTSGNNASSDTATVHIFIDGFDGP